VFVQDIDQSKKDNGMSIEDIDLFVEYSKVICLRRTVICL